MTQSDVQLSGWRAKIWLGQPSRPREAPAVALADYHALKTNRFKKALGISGLMLFCLIYGFFFSVFAPSYFSVFASPLVALVLLVIWALPDVNWAPTKLLEWLFYATFIALIVWPNYLAIALPGLPWITLLRLTSFPLVLVLLVCLSISANFRENLARSLNAISSIPILLGIFVFIQLLSIAFSRDVGTSVQKFVVAQTTWTAVFFIAAYIFARPGQIIRWASILWAMAIFVSLIAIWEYRIERLPWVGHIPSFLKIDDDAVQSILSPKMRAGTTRYRAEATFTTPLGLAEYISLTLPFVLHFTTFKFSPRVRAAAFGSIPLLLYASYLTDAKLGMVGALLGIVLYIFVTAYRNRVRNKQGLIAASVLFFYPVGLALLTAALLTVHRFQVLILGTDGSHAASTATRIQQYTIGIQKLLAWPFGYGIGMGALTIDPGGVSGSITIDAYYLSVILEYGIAGFIVYYGMFAIAIYESTRRSLLINSETKDSDFLLPISISLIAFFVIKSVFSQQDNHPIVFMMLGALMALASSGRKSFRKESARKAPTRIHRARSIVAS